MASMLRNVLPFAIVVAHLALTQQPVPVQRITDPSGTPAPGVYQPPALSLAQLLEHDHALSEAMMAFMQTGDKAAYRSTVSHAAESGDVGAELLLAEQYIPEECPFEPDQDVPYCGKNGDEPPHVIFRKNPLGIDASYEAAAHWLEKASGQGSGEATEVLAQLITRMLANGHPTKYTVADSARLHALARSQGFDVEPITVTCYKLSQGGSGIALGRLPGLIAGNPPRDPFTREELAALTKAGISGTLLYGGGTGWGESSLLIRAEGPPVHVRIILDHDPGAEVLLPMPAHHDVIYVQRGDEFLAFPSTGRNLPRFVTLEPQKESEPQVSVFTQHIDGANSGGFCTRFP